jgi:hypothetical protein
MWNPYYQPQCNNYLNSNVTSSSSSSSYPNSLSSSSTFFDTNISSCSSFYAPSSNSPLLDSGIENQLIQEKTSPSLDKPTTGYELLPVISVKGEYNQDESSSSSSSSSSSDIAQTSTPTYPSRYLPPAGCYNNYYYQGFTGNNVNSYYYSYFPNTQSIYYEQLPPTQTAPSHQTTNNNNQVVYGNSSYLPSYASTLAVAPAETTYFNPETTTNQPNQPKLAPVAEKQPKKVDKQDKQEDLASFKLKSMSDNKIVLSCNDIDFKYPSKRVSNDRIQARLLDLDMWNRFNELGTEMIITKSGRLGIVIIYSFGTL